MNYISIFLPSFFSLGYRTVAFNSPGESYYAYLMNLNRTNDGGITHVWNDCDPIPQGDCYACEFKASIDTRCHLGEICVIPAYCWFSRITYHRIEVMYLYSYVLANQRYSINRWWRLIIIIPLLSLMYGYM